MKKEIKQKVYNNRVLSKTITPLYLQVKRSKSFSSQDYWEKRYKKGGNSGTGSYGRLAEFKANVLNDFVKKNSINSVLELGVGDGAQLELFKFKNYTGFDVSKTSIAMCAEKFSKDKTKSFFLYEPSCFFDNKKFFTADLALSLDVIYHLVEDEVFDKYMKDLFSIANKYVIIYSSDVVDEKLSRAQHVRNRKFTDWIKSNANNWKLEKRIENKYKLKSDQTDESWADFYIYKKVR